MNNDLLKNLIVNVKVKNLGVKNVVVRQGGEVIVKHDFEEEKEALLWSVSKTFTSMAVGIAIEEGYLQLTDNVIDFFPGITPKNPNENLKNMKVHDLLCMGTGHDRCPVINADWSEGKVWDITKLFFDEPVIFKPGSHFTYNNGATYILSRIIGLTTGISLDDYLDKKIFQYLSIPKPRWDTCPLGIPQGFSGLHLTAEQLSRFGQLILNKGIWNDNELIPRNYIEKATTVQIETRDFNPHFATNDHHQGYGYQLWMNSYKGSYRMDGSYGQYVVILPDKDAVVTYISNEPINMTGVLELTWDTLIEKL